MNKFSFLFTSSVKKDEGCCFGGGKNVIGLQEKQEVTLRVTKRVRTDASKVEKVNTVT